MSFTAFVSHDVNDTNNIHLRISKVESEIFGGPVIGDKVGSIGQAIFGFDGEDSAQLFVDDDVSAEYIGKPWEMTEWIKTSREEAYAKWLTELNSELTSEFAISYANHPQDYFYEGIDYIDDDTCSGKINYATTLSAMLADKTFLPMIGGIKATPTTLFFDKEGKLLLKKRGYIPAAKLIAAADSISGSGCLG